MSPLQFSLKIIKLILLTVFFSFLLNNPQTVNAIVDPLTVSNNKFGIHILFPEEVEEVAKLVNSSGGDWGYVTIPIKADERDRIKWQKFFDDCLRLHLIPIMRLATLPVATGWEKGNLYEGVDFANFLNDLQWPTKNRFIIVYNEPNHAGEWGGQLSPQEYAKVLKYTTKIFKERSEDFFILPAGLDAAAPDGGQYLGLYNFVSQMVAAEPDVFEYIDGWTSHAYPNPGFCGTPTQDHPQSIASFRYELAFLKRFTEKELPVFITETGWKNTCRPNEQIASYYQQAFETIWKDERIVAVTPFLLKAGAGEFASFSLIDGDGRKKPQYQAIANIPKQKGEPKLSEEKTALAQVLGVKKNEEEGQTAYKSKKFLLSHEKWQKILEWLGVTLKH